MSLTFVACTLKTKKEGNLHARWGLSRVQHVFKKKHLWPSFFTLFYSQGKPSPLSLASFSLFNSISF